MGSLLQVRDVPDDDRRRLKARAAAQGLSLNAYMLRLISREVGRPTVEEVLDRAARRSERATASSRDAVATSRSERESDPGRRPA